MIPTFMRILTSVETTMQRRFRAAGRAAAAGLLVLLFSVDIRAQQPDFTGVWTTYNEPGQAPGGGRFGKPE